MRGYSTFQKNKNESALKFVYVLQRLLRYLVLINWNKVRGEISYYLLKPLAVGTMELDGETSCVLMAVDIINCEIRTTISLTCLITMYQSQYLSLMATEKRFPSAASEFNKAEYQIMTIQRLISVRCMYQKPLNGKIIRLLF